MADPQIYLRASIGPPEMYLTEEKQWDRPEALLTLRCRLVVRFEDGDHRELDARCAWTHHRIAWWRRRLLTTLVRWFRRHASIVGFLVHRSVSGANWCFEQEVPRG